LLEQLQLRGVFDRDDPLFVRDEARQDVEQRRLAAARATADENVALIDHAGPQKLGRRAGDRTALDQAVDRKLPRAEFADRQAWPADRQWGNDGVHAAAVGQAGIDQRLALVDAAANLSHDPLDDRLVHF